MYLVLYSNTILLVVDSKTLLLDLMIESVKKLNY